MKKLLSIIISVCCLTAVLASCKDDLQDTSDKDAAVSSSVSEQTETSVYSKKKQDTKPDKDLSSVPASVSDPVSDPDKSEDPDNASKDAGIQTKQINSKFEGYRSNIGTIYYAVNDLTCVNLTKDNDGYHLAMMHGDKYVPEYVRWFADFNNFGDVINSYMVMDDGTITDSDVITVHGCLECLCLTAVTNDGMRTNEYEFYPIDNFPDNTTENKQLVQFSSTLDDYEYKSGYYEETMPDFLDGDQKNLFANAEYLMCNAILSPRFDTIDYESYNIKDNVTCLPTGMSYSSFIEYTESVFTPAFSSDLLNSSEIFPNVRGELCIIDCARGSHIMYSGRSFKIISKSDDEIKFTLIAHFSAKEVCSDEQYNALPDNEKEFDEEYSFTMTNTFEGWRFSEFSFWL